MYMCFLVQGLNFTKVLDCTTTLNSYFYNENIIILLLLKYKKIYINFNILEIVFFFLIVNDVLILLQ